MFGIIHMVMVTLPVSHDVVQFQTARAVLPPLREAPIPLPDAVAHTHTTSNNLRECRSPPLCGRIIQDTPQAFTLQLVRRVQLTEVNE